MSDFDDQILELRQIAGTDVDIVELGGEVRFEAPTAGPAEQLVFEYRIMRDGEFVTETLRIHVRAAGVEGSAGLVDERSSKWEEARERAAESERKGLVVWFTGAMFSAFRMRGADEKR